MDQQTANTIKDDFLTWSGGFPPDSHDQILVYVWAARPKETNSREVEEILTTWIRHEEAAEE